MAWQHKQCLNWFITGFTSRLAELNIYVMGLLLVRASSLHSVRFKAFRGCVGFAHQKLIVKRKIGQTMMEVFIAGNRNEDFHIFVFNFVTYDSATEYNKNKKFAWRNAC
jgi:hypothetical protein